MVWFSVFSASYHSRFNNQTRELGRELIFALACGIWRQCIFVAMWLYNAWFLCIARGRLCLSFMCPELVVMEISC